MEIVEIAILQLTSEHLINIYNSAKIQISKIHNSAKIQNRHTKDQEQMLLDFAVEIRPVIEDQDICLWMEYLDGFVGVSGSNVGDCGR